MNAELLKKKFNQEENRKIERFSVNAEILEGGKSPSFAYARKEKGSCKHLYTSLINVNSDTMIIPIRCMTCGKPVGHLFEKFEADIKAGRNPKNVLDKLGLERYCCRSLFLSHKNLIPRVGQFKIVKT